MQEEQTIDALKARNIHLYVATPCYSCKATATYTISLMRLQSFCIQNGIRLSVDLMGNESLITRARNILTGRFLKSTATHLLFIDSDIGFDISTVFRLAVAEKDIISAIYPKKSIMWNRVREKLDEQDGSSGEPIMSMGLDYNINIVSETPIENGYAKVLDAATGCMLISRGTIERMCAHYTDELRCVNDIPGSMAIVPEYVALFDCMLCPVTRRYLSEDYAFMRRAQALGIETWADVATSLTHTGAHVFKGDVSKRFVATYVE
jgi:hypothetical protein